MALLNDKLGAVLIQQPPSMKKDEGLKKLKRLPLDERFGYAVEPRHKTWFDSETFDYFKDKNLCLASSQRDELQSPPVITTDFIHLRLIGDRSIPDNEFGTIQKDRLNEMHSWASEIKKLQSSKVLKSGVVPANNHYAGFGPSTANILRKLISLNAVTWYEHANSEEKKQPTLLDY